MERRSVERALVIRPLEPADDPAMHAIMVAEENFPTTAVMPSTTLASVSERTAKFAVDDARHSFGAFLGERLVGVAGLVQVPRPRLRHSASLWIEVHPEFHAQGVGSALMAKLVELADRWLGLVRVELHVNVDNERAVRLYERFGFEKEGRLRANVVRDGAYVDSFVMARIRPPPRFDAAPAGAAASALAR